MHRFFSASVAALACLMVMGCGAQARADAITAQLDTCETSAAQPDACQTSAHGWTPARRPG